MIKVFAVPSHASKEHTSGVDFARVIQPMKYLAEHKDFEVHTYDINNIEDFNTNWLKITKEYDLIFFNYTVHTWGFAVMGAMARHHGIPLVLDMDDSLWNVNPDNPTYNVYKKGEQAIKDFTAICNEVDLITTTNSYLRNVITHNTKKRHEDIKIVPNYIDLSLYKYKMPFKDDGQINLLHFGSTTHYDDLANKEFENGVDKIMKEYPNVKLKTVGHFLQSHRYKWGARYENAFGDRDLYKWVNEKFPTFLGEADIIVTPLMDNLYNRCKSSIKYLETSSACRVGVWQDIRQYHEVIVDGENGFLAQTADGWYRAIKKLIDDKELRKRMAENAYEDVKETWQIQDHVDQYANIFKEILK